MTRSWLLSLWEFVSTDKITLRKLKQPDRRSNYDGFIMEKVTQGNFNKTDIRLFNCCRIYLQVERISDILTADGKK